MDHSDLTNLEELTDKNVLRVLKRRYATNKIYTYSGHTLVSINPNTKLQIYGADVISAYTNSHKVAKFNRNAKNNKHENCNNNKDSNHNNKVSINDSNNNNNKVSINNSNNNNANNKASIYDSKYICIDNSDNICIDSKEKIDICFDSKEKINFNNNRNIIDSDCCENREIIGFVNNKDKDSIENDFINSNTDDYEDEEALEPHIYSVAEQAIATLNIQDHVCVIINGESGSGKTVNHNYLLEYLIKRTETEINTMDKHIQIDNSQESEEMENNEHLSFTLSSSQKLHNKKGKGESKHVSLTLPSSQKLNNKNRDFKTNKKRDMENSRKIESEKHLWNQNGEFHSTETVCYRLNDNLSFIIKQSLIAINPILEAFGNAQTTLNTNSSRFGKRLDLFFDFQLNIQKASLQTYLLEKSRVTHIMKGEKNFHIFYWFVEYYKKNDLRVDNDYLPKTDTQDNNLVDNKSNDDNKLQCQTNTDTEGNDTKSYDDTEITSNSHLGNTMGNKSSNDNESNKNANIDLSCNEYEGILDCFRLIQFENLKEVENILESILILGKIKFKEENDKSFIANEKYFKELCKLLEIKEKDMKEYFLFTIITMPRETIHKPNNIKNSLSKRDSLARSLYKGLFDYLIETFNKKLSCQQIQNNIHSNNNGFDNALGKDDNNNKVLSNNNSYNNNTVDKGSFKNAIEEHEKDTHTEGKGLGKCIFNNISSDDFNRKDISENVSKVTEDSQEKIFYKKITILDIFGFEVFEKNGFDQLCINWANEKIQKDFIKRMFVDIIQLYKDENIFLIEDEIEIQNMLNERGFNDKNKDKLRRKTGIDSLERECGIISLINEESICNGNDKNLLLKIQNFNKEILTKNNGFEIEHYANNVFYEIDSFLDKNNETTVEYKFLYPENIENLDNSDNSNRKDDNAIISSIVNEYRKVRKTGKNTILKTFKQSLDDLLGSLKDAKVFYVRCIKPSPGLFGNDSMRTAVFDDSYVMRQLKACGVMETIEISKKTFSHFMSYHEFYERYEDVIKSKGVSKFDKENYNNQFDCQSIEHTESDFHILKGNVQTDVLNKDNINVQLHNEMHDECFELNSNGQLSNENVNKNNTLSSNDQLHNESKNKDIVSNRFDQLHGQNIEFTEQVDILFKELENNNIRKGRTRIFFTNKTLNHLETERFFIIQNAKKSISQIIFCFYLTNSFEKRKKGISNFIQKFYEKIKKIQKKLKIEKNEILKEIESLKRKTNTLKSELVKVRTEMIQKEKDNSMKISKSTIVHLGLIESNTIQALDSLIRTNSMNIESPENLFFKGYNDLNEKKNQSSSQNELPISVGTNNSDYTQNNSNPKKTTVASNYVDTLHSTVKYEYNRGIDCNVIYQANNLPNPIGPPPFSENVDLNQNNLSQNFDLADKELLFDDKDIRMNKRNSKMEFYKENNIEEKNEKKTFQNIIESSDFNDKLRNWNNLAVNHNPDKGSKTDTYNSSDVMNAFNLLETVNPILQNDNDFDIKECLDNFGQKEFKFSNKSRENFVKVDDLIHREVIYKDKIKEMEDKLKKYEKFCQSPCRNCKTMEIKYKFQTEELKKNKTKDIEIEKFKLKVQILEEELNKLKNDKEKENIGKEFNENINLTEQNIEKTATEKDKTLQNFKIAQQSNNILKSHLGNEFYLSFTSPYDIFGCLLELFIENCPTLTCTFLPKDECLSFSNLLFYVVLRFMKTGHSAKDIIEILTSQLRERYETFERSPSKVAFVLSNFIELKKIIVTNYIIIIKSFDVPAKIQEKICSDFIKNEENNQVANDLNKNTAPERSNCANNNINDQSRAFSPKSNNGYENNIITNEKNVAINFYSDSKTQDYTINSNEQDEKSKGSSQAKVINNTYKQKYLNKKDDNINVDSINLNSKSLNESVSSIFDKMNFKLCQCKEEHSSEYLCESYVEKKQDQFRHLYYLNLDNFKTTAEFISEIKVTQFEELINEIEDIINVLNLHLCDMLKTNMIQYLPDAIINYQGVKEFKCREKYFSKFFGTKITINNLINSLEYTTALLNHYHLPEENWEECINHLLRVIDCRAFNGLMVKNDFLSFNRGIQINNNINCIEKFLREVQHTTGCDFLKNIKAVVILINYTKSGVRFEKIIDEIKQLNPLQIIELFSKFVKNERENIKFIDKMINVAGMKKFLKEGKISTVDNFGKTATKFMVPRYVPSKYIKSILESL